MSFVEDNVRMSQNDSEAPEGVFEQDSLAPEERSALYTRWFDVSLDIDRQLLTLSLACLGVLATLLAGNVLKTKLQFALWAIACLVFFVEIAVLLAVFFLNKRLLTTILANDRHQPDRCLDIVESASRWVFFLALFSTIVFLGSVAVDKLISVDTEEKLDERQKPETGTGIQWPRYRGGRSFWVEPGTNSFPSAGASDQRTFTNAEADCKAGSGDSNGENKTAIRIKQEKMRPGYYDSYR